MDNAVISQAGGDEEIPTFDIPDEALELGHLTWIVVTNHGVRPWPKLRFHLEL